MNNKQFAIIFSITFFVGMIWLVADILFNTKASIPVSPKLEAAIEDVNPTFNTRVLDIINKETLGKNDITLTESPPVPETSTAPSAQGSESAQLLNETQISP